jgi:hypothetical protein
MKHAQRGTKCGFMYLTGMQNKFRTLKTSTSKSFANPAAFQYTKGLLHVKLF